MPPIESYHLLPHLCLFTSFSVRVRLRFVILAGVLVPGEALADHLGYGQLEAVEIVHVLAEFSDWPRFLIRCAH